MPKERQIGPVEANLRASCREDIRRLCDLSNLELLDLMEREFLSPGDGFDEELFDAARDLLDERSPVDAPIDPEESYKRFMGKYADELHGSEERRARVNTYPRRRFRRLACVAVIAILVAGVFSVGAIAAGKTPLELVYDAGETLIRTLTWGPSGALELSDASEGYHSLEEALVSIGADDAKEITWIPTRLKLESVFVYEFGAPGQSSYTVWAYFDSADSEIVYSISNFPTDENSFASEKEPGIECVQIGGKEYLVTQNAGWLETQWSENGYSYILTGNLDQSDLEKVILSLK